MAVKVNLCVFSESEEVLSQIEEVLADWGPVNTYLDSGSEKIYVAAVNLEWDFTNWPLYRLIEFVTEIDCNVEIEVYPEGGQFDIIASADGDEEHEIVFEYSLFDQSYLNDLSLVDRVLFNLNTGSMPGVPLANLSTSDTAILKRFFELGVPYGVEHIYEMLQHDSAWVKNLMGKDVSKTHGS